MAEYLISHVLPNDTSTLAQIDELLLEEGITRDKNLDYICVMYDEDYHVIATGSCFGHTLRCFAVSSKHQGELFDPVFLVYSEYSFVILKETLYLTNFY